MKIENENTFKDALSKGCSLFLGAGFSVLAKDGQGNPLPTGTSLALELVENFQLEGASGLTLAQICTILMHDRRKEFQSYIKRRFSVGEFDSRYYYLERVNIKTLFTTNVDDLLYKVYAESTEHYLNDLDIKGPVFNDRKAIDVVALNGSVIDNNRPLKFSATEVASAFHSDPDRWHYLTQRIQSCPTLFWGYGMGDSATLEALCPQSVSGRSVKDLWATLPEDSAESTIQFFRALGFQIIIASTDEMLNYVGNLKFETTVPAIEILSLPTKTLFPDEALPDIGTVPARPIIEFYLGAPPSWSDISSGRLHRTTHFYTMRDSINSGKNTIVVGMSGSGKTTLMMQVAQEISFGGHKLVCEAPTVEKAKLITSISSGGRALIFIDNFADSADAFEYLVEQRNMVVVGFDREYNFENVSDRIDVRRCNVLEVTELPSHDIQEILAKIPENIRSPYIRKLTEGPAPSLFEVIEANINRPSLNERFKSVLSEIGRHDENLLDLLLVSCYVHSCRTPVSMDMLIAFLRGVATNYHDIYRMCDRLKPMIADYYGPFADKEQDYWMPRSTIMSEAILKQASSLMLKRVLLRFLRQVSPFRIHRFDVFRRRAYDATLIGKVFPNWEEGMGFYEEAYNRDASYYLRQQGALYLSHKKRVSQAFAWIDEAVTQSGGKNLSIRNSHAVILFRANINKDSSNPTVSRTLQQSMDILSECYHQDKRKTHHALTFADQAMQYWNIFTDKTAHEYLETAETWLAEEETKEPWNRAVRRLRRDLAKLGR